MKKLQLVNLCLIGLMVIGTLVCFQKLPAEMPVHFTFDGTADSFASKYVGGFIFPLTALALLFLQRVVPLNGANQMSIEVVKISIARIMTGIILFLSVIHFAVIYQVLANVIVMGKIVPYGLCLLFIYLGVLMRKLPQNYVAGLRMPWTLSSNTNWERAHSILGWTMIIMGLGSLLVLTLALNY